MWWRDTRDMMEEKREQEPALEKETNRLEAFSDGVFAVAITLLVFNLNVPTLDKAATPQLLAEKLFAQWPAYIAFIISFATILIMWVSHHSLFKLVYKSNTSFMFANGFLLLLVTIVPFPTRLVAEYLTTAAAATACAVYAGLFVIINFAYNILWWSAAYHHHLLRPDVSPSVIRVHTRNYLFGLPCYLVAMVLAFWSPLASFGICSLLWIFWAFTSYAG
jgi:uncharacterized membrane protein